MWENYNNSVEFVWSRYSLSKWMCSLSSSLQQNTPHKTNTASEQMLSQKIQVASSYIFHLPFFRGFPRTVRNGKSVTAVVPWIPSSIWITWRKAGPLRIRETRHPPALAFFKLFCGDWVSVGLAKIWQVLTTTLWNHQKISWWKMMQNKLTNNMVSKCRGTNQVVGWAQTEGF